MQHTLAELEQSPDSPLALPQQATAGNEPVTRTRHFQLYLYILRGALLLALTCTVFYSGVTIIRQNTKALGLISLNFDVPLPFLFIGLWSLVTLILSIFLIATLSKIGVLFTQILLRRPSAVQR